MPSVRRFDCRSRQPSPCASIPRVYKRWAGGPSMCRETSLSFQRERTAAGSSALASRGDRGRRGWGLLLFEPPCALLLEAVDKSTVPPSAGGCPCGTRQHCYDVSLGRNVLGHDLNECAPLARSLGEEPRLRSQPSAFLRVDLPIRLPQQCLIGLTQPAVSIRPGR
jgi:hypothetical protein